MLAALSELHPLLSDKRVDWRSVAANFCFSVGIIGVLARAASMCSIVLLSFLPYSPVFAMAYLYSLIESCPGVPLNPPHSPAVLGLPFRSLTV